MGMTLFFHCFGSISAFFTDYTVYSVLFIFTLKTKAFSHFSPLFFLCLLCNEQALSLRAPEGSVVLKASVLLALPGYFLGTRRLNVIYWMLFTDLLEWLKSQCTIALDIHTSWLGSLQQTNQLNLWTYYDLQGFPNAVRWNQFKK